MGRLGHHKSGSSARPFLRVHYRKLVEDYADVSSPLPPLPDYFSYCCCKCGHTQKVKSFHIGVISLGVHHHYFFFVDSLLFALDQFSGSLSVYYIKKERL
ncbi:hypothetical protein RUM44_010465 [Polyplax serrata]|uniref:Uncharacterized protein n=1 Tax=Polyplax serrata TaxID=468196 RepID=A0ABR1AX40_POLSC